MPKVGLSFAQIALACKCAPGPTPNACPLLPDASRRNEAVYIGTVVESLPKSWQDLFELAERLRGRKFSFKIDQSDDEREPTPKQERELLDAMKRVTLFIWRDTLTPLQREQIQRAKSTDGFEGPAQGVPWPGRRVRLRVSERFVGPGPFESVAIPKTTTYWNSPPAEERMFS